MPVNVIVVFVCVALSFLPLPLSITSQSIASPFNTTYSLVDLGTVKGLPSHYGALAFQLDSPSTLLIAANINSPDSAVYTVDVNRDHSLHITSMGIASLLYPLPYLSACLAYVPNSKVLLYSILPGDSIGQIDTDDLNNKTTSLSIVGIESSVSGCVFVPIGFPCGDNTLKMVTYTDSMWYTVDYVTDEQTHLFNITSAEFGFHFQSENTTGVVYVPPHSPLLPVNALMANEQGEEEITVYEVNTNGDPIDGTRVVMVNGLFSSNGLVVDPLSGDVLISSSNEQHLYRITGFNTPSANTMTMIDAHTQTD